MLLDTVLFHVYNAIKMYRMCTRDQMWTSGENCMEDLVSAMDKKPGYSYFYYKGFVRHALEHATSAWSYAITKAELARLNILQARVARKYLLRKKVNVDRCETKSQLNALCDLESWHFHRQDQLLLLYLNLYIYLQNTSDIFTFHCLQVQEDQTNFTSIITVGVFLPSFPTKLQCYGIAYRLLLPL